VFVTTRDNHRDGNDVLMFASATRHHADDVMVGAPSVARPARRSGGGLRALAHGARRDQLDDGLASPQASSQLLDDADLRAIEDTYPGGITAVQIVEVFTSRGIKFSEASFRKYVQLGLLPRSRRVGRKGKHRGSLGVYPAKTVRRINAVKALMAAGHTIEEISGEVLVYTDLAETVQEAITELLGRLAGDIAGPRGERDRRQLDRELGEVRAQAQQLVDRLAALVRQLGAPKAERIRRTGAAGSAEDLL